MNKEAFLKGLAKDLKALKKSEIQKNISFYDEMISDLMENGFTEAEAVAQIGASKKVAEEVLSNSAPECFRKKDVIGTILIVISAVTVLLAAIPSIAGMIMQDVTVSVIGGADGPTSIYLAGRIGGLSGMVIVAVIMILVTIVYKIVRKRREK